MTRAPQAGDIIEYRLTGGTARQINNQFGAGTVTAGDWARAQVTGVRPHASRDEDVLIGIVLDANGFPQGVPAVAFDGSVMGEGFGCWRWPVDKSEG